jgi:cell division protein FtsI/penicillin-binding protein 2
MGKERAIRRALVAFVALGLGALAVVGRLIQLQVLQHEEWSTLASRMHEEVVELPAKRGTIYDRNGKPVAVDVPAYDIALDNYHMTKPELLVPLLVEEFGLPQEEAETKVYRASYFTWLARRVDRGVGAKLRDRAHELGIQGLLLLDTWKRAYPQGELALEVIGIVGVDGYGLEGLEYSFDERLRGQPKRLRLLRGPGSVVYDLWVEDPGAPGDDLHLTLDIDIQRICEEEVAHGLEEFKAKAGFALVTDPHRGEILALAQAPRYDSAHPDPALLHPWAVTDAFEPGSSFKAMVALSALDLGLVEPKETFSGDSPLVVAGVPIKNAEGRSYGLVTFHRAMVQSINTVLIQVGQRLGVERLHEYLERMGFGRPTGIELPGEATGILRPPEEWTKVDLATASFGQGVSVSGVQLGAAFGAIANGGTLLRPRLVAGLPEPVARVASPEATARLREILRDAVQLPGSTGHAASVAGFKVGGKSGTAEKALPGRGYVPGHYVGVMATFFPWDAPEYVVLVVYDDLKNWGGATAGRTVHDIIQGMAYTGIIEPYEETTALGRSG